VRFEDTFGQAYIIYRFPYISPTLLEKWQVDEDKLTFIILGRVAGDLEDFSPGIEIFPRDERLKRLPMIGDVNIFLNGTLPSLGLSQNRAGTLTKGDAEQDGEDEFQAEVDIMIAGKYIPFHDCPDCFLI